MKTLALIGTTTKKELDIILEDIKKREIDEIISLGSTSDEVLDILNENNITILKNTNNKTKNNDIKLTVYNLLFMHYFYDDIEAVEPFSTRPITSYINKYKKYTTVYISGSSYSKEENIIMIPPTTNNTYFLVEITKEDVTTKKITIN